MDGFNHKKLSIHCARCQRPVSGYHLWFDEWRNSWGIEAQCHGESEECFIDHRFADDLYRADKMGEKITVEAFKERPLIEHAKQVE